MQAKIKDMIAIMENNFPLYLAESWDNVGLQVGAEEQVLNRVMVALDLDAEIMEQAIAQRVEMIITHHPFIFKPLKTINYATMQSKIIKNLIKRDIAVYAAHTNLDSAERGLNQILAEKLGLRDIKPLFSAISEELYKIVVFVPAPYGEIVRGAMNGAGAGHIGAYSDCSFRVRGTGTFCPGENTNPYLGQIGRMEEVDEYRLETVAYRRNLPEILQAMLAAHPYEEVAYDLYRLENHGLDYCPGRQGYLSQPLILADYALQVKAALGLDYLQVVGDLHKRVQKIAVISGAGASFLSDCIKQGMDLLITGDLKYHEAREAEAAGLALIDAGHQGTEQIVVEYLCQLLPLQCQQAGMEIEVIPAFSSPCFKQV